jgi:hypothetical protein
MPVLELAQLRRLSERTRSLQKVPRKPWRTREMEKDLHRQRRQVKRLRQKTWMKEPKKRRKQNQRVKKRQVRRALTLKPLKHQRSPRKLRRIRPYQIPPRTKLPEKRTHNQRRVQWQRKVLLRTKENLKGRKST